MEHDHKLLGWVILIGCAIGLIGTMASDPRLIGSPSPTPVQFAAQATVLVSSDDGHGSGVVIGKGLALTVAHAIGNKAEMKITLSTGVEKTGRVLWVGKGKNDAALIEVATDDVVPASLRCRRAELGERVMTFGNPFMMRSTATWGRVASDVETDAAAEGRVLDLTMLPGNSGGGVWAEEGGLLGLADAVMTAPTGMIGKSYTGISVMLPSTVLCRMLGRV